MEEVQGWWEVPAIAHFFYAFRDAFNLVYFEIGELEAAILNMQDPDMSISLEQLIMKLLEGIFDNGEVRSDNWEEKMQELFDENCEDGNPLAGTTFHFLSPHLKVEVLHKLCEFRLDTEDALDIIRDIPAENMKATCVGKDSQNNLYWYFCDERLYKEDPSKKPKKPTQPVKNVNIKNNTVKNGKRSTTRERKPVTVENDSPWSIACYNSSDWESLVKVFSKSKNANEKELVCQITTKYLPLLTEVVAEKDRLLRKRYLELAPKRVSSRISKVQAQRKLEEQKAAEAAEAKRLKQEEKRTKEEAERKIKEKDERRRRAEEREKNMYARTFRVKQREMMHGCETDSESEGSPPPEPRPRRVHRSKTESTEQEMNGRNELSENELSSRNSRYETRPRRACRTRTQSTEQNTNSENDTSGNESSSKNSSRRQSVNNGSCDDNFNVRTLRRSRSPLKSDSSCDLRSGEEQKFVNGGMLSNSNKEMNSHKENISYSHFTRNKRLKPNQVSNTKTISPIIPKKDSNTPYCNENIFYLNTCPVKLTSTPAIIRLGIAKPHG